MSGRNTVAFTVHRWRRSKIQFIFQKFLNMDRAVLNTSNGDLATNHFLRDCPTILGRTVFNGSFVVRAATITVSWSPEFEDSLASLCFPILTVGLKVLRPATPLHPYTGLGVHKTLLQTLVRSSGSRDSLTVFSATRFYSIPLARRIHHCSVEGGAFLVPFLSSFWGKRG